MPLSLPRILPNRADGSLVLADDRKQVFAVLGADLTIHAEDARERRGDVRTAPVGSPHVRTTGQVPRVSPLPSFHFKNET